MHSKNLDTYYDRDEATRVFLVESSIRLQNVIEILHFPLHQHRNNHERTGMKERVTLSPVINISN